VLIPVNMRCPPLISGVSWDNYLVGRMAAEHLAGLGHKHLLCVGLDYDQLWVENRISGFKDYCNENSIRYDILNARSGKQAYPVSEISREIGQNNAMRIVKEYKATAVFAVNDALAYGIYETFTANGIKIPEDYSLVGCDNDYALPWSGLTTFNLECIRAAETAADVIMNYLKSDNHLVWPVELKIQPRLIVRESTAAPGFCVTD